MKKNKLRSFFTVLPLIFFVLHYGAFSQIKGIGVFDEEKLSGIEKTSDASADLMKGDYPAVGSVVDAEFYKLGPGDVLVLQNLITMPEQTPLMVTPESSVLIPRIGVISVKEKTLAEARKMIIDAYKEKNPNALVSVALYKPRNVFVTIKGNVNFPGTYVFSAAFRVSTAIKSANEAKITQQMPQEMAHRLMMQRDDLLDKRKNTGSSGLPEEIIYSTRMTEIYRAGGNSQTADIEKAYVRGSAEFDPYLQEGDVISVPFKPDNFPFIQISGGVKRPCKLLFREGDMASDLLRFSFGPAPGADIENVSLFIPEKNLRTKLNVDKNFNLLGSDYELSPGSIITVGMKKPDKASSYGIAAVAGEVESPGTYPITLGQTRLKDIIESAGGLTPQAYLPLGKIIRYGDYTPEPQSFKDEYYKLVQYSDLKPADSIRTKIDVKLKHPLVSADFTKALVNHSEKENVLLKDGDLIVIPAKPTHIFVWGQVNNPGYIEFKEGKTMDWYIAQAGGHAEGADIDRARIIRGKNKVWTEGENNVFVFAGDEIYVPHEIFVDPSLQLQKYAAIAGILGSTAALLNVIIWLLTR